jgi:uncharacterized protein (TIGR02271 family)
LDIGTRKRATGAVRVEKESTAHDETVSMPLTRERAEVRRVMIDKPVDGPLPSRREGDTIIMPVVQEVAVVEKRMILKEEIHITRHRSTEQHEETVTLHTEHAAVERTDASGRPIAPQERPVTVGSDDSPLPPEERSILDPTKPRPSVLGPRRKAAGATPTARRVKKFLDKD